MYNLLLHSYFIDYIPILFVLTKMAYPVDGRVETETAWLIAERCFLVWKKFHENYSSRYGTSRRKSALTSY